MVCVATYLTKTDRDSWKCFLTTCCAIYFGFFSWTLYIERGSLQKMFTGYNNTCIVMNCYSVYYSLQDLHVTHLFLSYFAAHFSATCRMHAVRSRSRLQSCGGCNLQSSQIQSVYNSGHAARNNRQTSTERYRTFLKTLIVCASTNTLFGLGIRSSLVPP